MTPAQVSRILQTYCDRMDAGDFDGIGELFAAGRLVDPDGNEIAAGATAVSDFYRSIVKLHDGSPRTKHTVTVLQMNESSGRTVVRSAYLVLQDDRPIIAGRYTDVVADGGFLERKFFVDLTGDLSEHLLITV